MRALALACGLLCAAASAAPLVAGSPAPAAIRAYERGTRELEFSRFAEAATAFREAIEIDPAESADLVARPSGMNFEPYLPHLALGVADCERGEVVAAVASWSESDRQSAAAGARGAERLFERRRSCAARRLGEARAGFDAQIDAARRVLSERPQADLVDRLDRLVAAGQPVDLPGWVERGRAVAEIADAARAAPAASVALAATVEGDSGAGDPPPTPAGLAPVAPPAATAGGAVEADPPAPLLAAATALFAGEPSAALDALRGFRPESARGRAQAHLIRAAAGFALARLGGAQSDVRFRLARAERDSARAVDPALRPDRRYFSPEFVAFFESDLVPSAILELLAP